MSKYNENKLVPNLRFPEFVNDGEWSYPNGDELFEPIVNKNHNSDLTILAITQEQGAIPRDMIDYHVSVTEKSIESYKVVEVGDFIISLRSFQGGIEYSNYRGLCSPAYIIIRKKVEIENDFYRHYFKSVPFIRDLNKNLEGIRDGKMISYKQFSEILIPKPKPKEQYKIAACLASLDEVITAENVKLEVLKEHKKGLLQNLFPQSRPNRDSSDEMMSMMGTKKNQGNQENQKNQGSDNVPKLRFKEFEESGEWIEEMLGNVIDYFKGFAFQSKDYTTHGRRIIRVSDMGFDYIQNEENAIYINEKDSVQYEKWQLKKDDLIITTVGSKPPMYDSIVGRSIVVESKDENSLLNQNAVCFRANSKIIQGFLNTLFKKGEYVTFIKSIIRGNANQGSIALEDLFKYKFLKPKSSKEQQKIASALSSIDELITAQGQKLEVLQMHKKGLLQGLFPNLNET